MSKESITHSSHEVMPEYAIAEATPEDAKGIAEVQKEGWLTTYVNDEYGVTEADVLSKDFGGEAHVSRWAEAATKPGTKTWVAKDGDNVVGFCFVKSGEDVNHLGALYVLSSTRGTGIGSKLVEQALNYLGREKPIELEVASYNDNAINFYEKFGFKNMGKVEDPTSGGLPSGAQIPELKMVLDKEE